MQRLLQTDKGGAQSTPASSYSQNATGEYYFQVGANANDMINLKISSGFHMWGIFSMAGLDKKGIQETGKLSEAAKTDKMGLYMSAAGKYSALRWSVITPAAHKQH